MSEIRVQFASRYIRRKQSDAVGKNLLKTLTEPITNSDDSYGEIFKAGQANANDIFPIVIYIDKVKRMVRITDNAQGMGSDELEAKFKEYGAAKSSAYKGGNSRGIFGQGISDVLFYHRDGKIKTIKDGEASVCSFYWKNDKQYISVEKINKPLPKIIKEWGMIGDRGTVVEFFPDNTTIHDYENLVKKLSVFYMLRLINADARRKVKLVYKENRGTKESIIRYQFPQGDLVEHKEFLFQYEDYDAVKVDIQLYKSNTPLATVGDERENGLLVYDDKKAVYAQTFFGWDSLPGADKFFGYMELTGAREIILEKINDPKHPEAILSDSRDGFNMQHDFYKKLCSEVRDWLYPILNEERKKRTNEGVSESTIEKHRKAFDELNKLYKQLAGEDISGMIKSKRKSRPMGGLEFARNNITVTAGKRYGLQLMIDTRIIKKGSTITLKSSKNLIGFSPIEIEVEQPAEGNDDILTKTIIVTGAEARTADTLEARVGERKASVVVSIVSEDVVYPEKGIVFSPDYARSAVNRDGILNLYVDLGLIAQGSKVSYQSANSTITLKQTKIAVPGRMRSTNKIAKIEVSFVGQKDNETGIIEASIGEYSAQCRVDIQDRARSNPTGPTGKFRDWDFDEGVPKHMQTTFDSIQESPTQGFILINTSHPINRYYFGENPHKKDLENSHEAQLYLAELILNESLGAMIPEAYKKGAVSVTYGPEYDIPMYIAQKKFELGPMIYDLFVDEPSVRETKREAQLEEMTKGKVLTDSDIVEGMEQREKQMIEMRFGFNDQRPHTLEEIAQQFKVTRERVRQIINKALARKFGDYNYSEDNSRDFIAEQEKEIGSTVEKIISVVARFYSLNLREIKQRTRKANIVKPRQIAIYLVRDMIKLSFPAIGKLFNLDHSTVIHSFEKIGDSISTDNILEEQLSSIKTLVNATTSKL